MEIGKPKWSVGSSLAAAIAATAPPSIALSFVAFGSKESKVLQAEKDHHDLVEQITLLRDQKLDIHPRHTKLWDSVASTIDKPLPLQSGDAIFIVSDGADNASHNHPEELERRLYGSGIRVFAFALDSGDPKTEEEHAGPENLREFAKRSGGDCLILQGSSSLGVNSLADFSMSLEDRQEIQNTIVRFLTEAVRPYRVELAPEGASRAGRLKIEFFGRGFALN
jgi:hypothetical protein